MAMRPVFEVDDEHIDVFCAACGVPLEKNPHTWDIAKYDWWDTITLRFVESENGEFRMETHKREDVIFPSKSNPEAPVHNSLQPFVQIAFHPKCLEMVRRMVNHREFLKSLGKPLHGPVSLKEFWELFRNRIDLDVRGFVWPLGSWMTQPMIKEPHDYYFHERKKLTDYLQWPIGCLEVAEFEIAPYPIPCLTYEILKFLVPLQEEFLSAVTSHVLPTELIDQIYQELLPFQDVSPLCSRRLPPSFWRSLLIKDHMFPWLWDLDSEIINEYSYRNRADQTEKKEKSSPSFSAENFWDWELLVRQLAQANAFEPGKPMERAPLGLRNRRRIWRLLEDARYGDAQEYCDRKTLEKLKQRFR